MSNLILLRLWAIAILQLRFRRQERVAIAICLVLTVGILAGCDDRAVPDPSVFSTSAELMRVSSPNGQLDAVLVRDPYGAAAGGGVDSNVYIVRKAAPIHMKTSHPFFQADPMTGGILVWKRNHLLEIHYTTAHIHQFRNLWGLHEVEDTGSVGERDYDVEIQLVPTSDSSVLSPDGSFVRNDE